MGKSIFIAEKPSVAREFAKALKLNAKNKDGYMEGENISGWLIPFEQADKFEKEYLKGYGDLEDWEEYFCWIEWENENNPEITICGIV